MKPQSSFSTPIHTNKKQLTTALPFASLLDALPDCVFICRDEQIVFANQTAKDGFELSNTPSWQEIVHTHDLPNFRWWLAQQTHPTFTCNTNGTTTPRLEFTRSESPQKEMSLLIGRVPPQTDLRTLGKISGVFNNLLTALSGNIQLTALDTNEAHTLESLDELEAIAQKAIHFSSQLLDASTYGNFHLRPVHLHDFIEIVRKQDAFARFETAHTHITFDLKPVANTQVDTTQILRALFELIDNALRHGGAHVHVSTEERAEHVVLCVADDGNGMTPEQQKQLGIPFPEFALPNKGMGLAAVKGIVEGHQGKLAITSSPGQGTQIIVMLPKHTPVS